MATSSLPSVPPNPFDSLSKDDRLLINQALACYHAVLKRRYNAEKNDRIKEIVHMDMLQVVRLQSNALES